jgi:hypothetical protein
VSASHAHHVAAVLGPEPVPSPSGVVA